MLGLLHGRANGPHVFGKGIYGMLHCYWYNLIVSYSFQVLHSCICGLTINSWQSFEVIDRRIRILRSLSLVVHEFTTQGHFISWRAHLGVSIFLRPERKCTALMWSRWFLIFQVVFLGVRSDGSDAEWWIPWWSLRSMAPLPTKHSKIQTCGTFLCSRSITLFFLPRSSFWFFFETKMPCKLKPCSSW